MLRAEVHQKIKTHDGESTSPTSERIAGGSFLLSNLSTIKDHTIDCLVHFFGQDLIRPNGNSKLTPGLVLRLCRLRSCGTIARCRCIHQTEVLLTSIRDEDQGRGLLLLHIASLHFHSLALSFRSFAHSFPFALLLHFRKSHIHWRVLHPAIAGVWSTAPVTGRFARGRRTCSNARLVCAVSHSQVSVIFEDQSRSRVFTGMGFQKKADSRSRKV